MVKKVKLEDHIEFVHRTILFGLILLIIKIFMAFYVEQIRLYKIFFAIPELAVFPNISLLWKTITFLLVAALFYHMHKPEIYKIHKFEFNRKEMLHVKILFILLAMFHYFVASIPCAVNTIFVPVFFRTLLVTLFIFSIAKMVYGPKYVTKFLNKLWREIVLFGFIYIAILNLISAAV